MSTTRLLWRLDTLRTLLKSGRGQRRWNGGTHSGQQAIEKMFETDFKLNSGKMVNKLVQLYPIANDVCAIANTGVGTWKSNTVTIYVRALDPDTWKVQMTYVSELPP